MSHSPRPIEPRQILTTLANYPARWAAPTIALTALALFYALFLHRPSWEARQSLLIRDEAASDRSNHGRPGRFEGLDAMKTAQETVLELARSRAVVSAALAEIGPPKNYKSPLLWPTARDVEDAQGRLQVKAPNGAEFGKTEVFHIVVRNRDRERALALTRALANRLDARLQLVRDRKAESLMTELSETVELARKDLETATRRLSGLEQSVGGDLAELRLLSDSIGGESNLRMSLTAVKNDLRAVRVSQTNHRQLLDMLRTAQQDPTHLMAAPNHLLVSQPALQRLKDGLVDAQLAKARLQGNMTETHPLVEAAGQSEAEIRRHLHREIAVAIRGIEAEIELGEGRIATLEEQAADITRRMEHLAAIRADYANAASEVRHYDEMLKQAQQELAAARASRATADTTSLLTRLEEPYTGSRPSGPSRSSIVLAGLLGGLATGLGLLFLVPPVQPAESPATGGIVSTTQKGSGWFFGPEPCDVASVSAEKPPRPLPVSGEAPLPTNNGSSRLSQPWLNANSFIANGKPVRGLSLKQALSRLTND